MNEKRLLLVLYIVILIIASLVGHADGAHEKKKRDYYKVLGVARNADDKTLKKAYRKLSLEHHPDKNPDDPDAAQEKFLEVSEAYQVLSDPDERAAYDQYGHAGPGGGGSGGGGPQPGGGGGFHHRGGGGGGNFRFKSDPFDMFSNFFGGGGGGGMGGMGGRGGMGGMGGQQPKPKDLYAKDSPVKTLVSRHFPDAKSNYIWLVAFYSSGCGHCQQMVEAYEKTATKLKGVVKVGAVNCDKNAALCKKHGATSYPTIVLIEHGKVLGTYSGGRKPASMASFALDLLPSDAVTNIRHDMHLEDFFTACDNSAWHKCALLLTSKYETAPLFKSLASQFSSQISFGEIRAADKNTRLATDRLGVTSFPTVLVFDRDSDSMTPAVYSGKMNREELESFFKQFDKNDKKSGSKSSSRSSSKTKRGSKSGSAAGGGRNRR